MERPGDCVYRAGSRGADYNLLLITRIREESGRGTRTGVIRALRSTSGVIITAGVIFAASMCGLLAGVVTTIEELGFVTGAACSLTHWCAPSPCGRWRC